MSAASCILILYSLTSVPVGAFLVKAVMTYVCKARANREVETRDILPMVWGITSGMLFILTDWGLALLVR